MTDSPPTAAVYYRRSRFTTHLPRERRYTASHYWLLEESPRLWRVGFTKFATRMIGDIVEYAFSSAVGDNIATGDEIGWVEGLKAVTNVFAAGTGTFRGAGRDIREDVTLIDSDPYGRGWLYRFEGDAPEHSFDVASYVAVLDATIDKMLASRHGESEETE